MVRGDADQLLANLREHEEFDSWDYMWNLTVFNYDHKILQHCEMTVISFEEDIELCFYHIFVPQIGPAMLNLNRDLAVKLMPHYRSEGRITLEFATGWC